MEQLLISTKRREDAAQGWTLHWHAHNVQQDMQVIILAADEGTHSEAGTDKLDNIPVVAAFQYANLLPELCCVGCTVQ